MVRAAKAHSGSVVHRRLLVIGCGDVVRRILPQLLQRWQVLALVRVRDPHLAALGVRQVVGDLDQPGSLRRLAGLADAVLHSAPPPADGLRDTRMQHLISALRRGKSLPRRWVYISTTGIYGDHQGGPVGEALGAVRGGRREKANAAEAARQGKKSARAIRRMDAEGQLRGLMPTIKQIPQPPSVRYRKPNPARHTRSGRCTLRPRACCVSILRAPGIYAADRLPLARLREGLPLFLPDQDSYTNHIHALDLGRACQAALRRGRPNRAYNICDDSALKMGEWFDLLADEFSLPRAPRLAREEVKQAVSPMQWSFMRESRQLDNGRMKRELGVFLRYPTVESGIKKNNEK